MADAFVDLSAEESGFVLAATLNKGSAPALEWLAPGPEATRCRAAWGRIAALPRQQRAAALARLARDVFGPVSAALEHIKPGWIEAALEREASPVVVALVAGLPQAAGDAARRVLARRGEALETVHATEIAHELLADLRRAVLGPLAAVAPAGSRAAVLAELPDRELIEEIDRLGAETLGLSLRGAPRALVARATALAGAGRRTVLDAARGPVNDEARERARALVAAAAVDDRTVERVRVVGLRALGLTLRVEGEQAARAVALRLPVVLGRILLRGAGTELS